MEVRVPQLAEGVVAGTVVAVLVKEGDAVKKDQSLIELETNKAVAAINSPGEGTISRVAVKEGDEVPVGGLLMTLVSSGSAPVSSAPIQQLPASAAAASAPPFAVQSAPVSAQAGIYQYQSKGGFLPPASPTLRRLADDLGIDLGRVKGSEHGGRIVLPDLKAYVQFLQAKTFSGETISAPAVKSSAVTPSVDFSKFGPVTRKKMTKLRKTISDQMMLSWTSTPRVTQLDEPSIDHVLALRKKYVEVYKKKGAGLTLTPFILKAVVAALKKHPIFNTSLDEAAGELVFKEYYHIGIAVDTEQGLIVPVIRDVDQKSLFDLSVELAALAQKTRDRKVVMDELQGASFTISNQGSIGGTYFTPIINKPEAAILGIGRGGPKPVVRANKVVVANLMPVALSYDHRIIDGGSAARFIVDFAEALNLFTETDLALPRQTEGGQAGRKKPATHKADKQRGKK